MNPFEMVVLIVAIVMIASVLKSRRKGVAPAADSHTVDDNLRLREEVRALKERVAVLERLATDTRQAVSLDREIENLR